MNEYKWWGKEGEPPPNFKTKKQLAEFGLAPLKPSGVIKCRDCDLFLYDINNPEACRPKRKCSPKQLETLSANRLKAKIKRDYKDWYNEIGFLEKDRVAAVLWTREQLSQNDWVIMDTETTGLYDAEIVEIAVVNCTGKALLNTLVKPTITIPAEVTGIHGITDEMVVYAPVFPEVSPTDAVIKDKRILIYNAAFDIKILNYCCRLHNLPILKLAKRSDCLMEWVAL